jgi:hypothetical protein
MYVLPLAYQHTGLLHAILGLAACHLRSSEIDTSQSTHTAAIQHKLLAIQSLGSLLSKEEFFGLNDAEELALAIVLILVLDDVSQSYRARHKQSWSLTGKVLTYTDLRFGEIPSRCSPQWRRISMLENRGQAHRTHSFQDIPGRCSGMVDEPNRSQNEHKADLRIHVGWISCVALLVLKS